MKKLFIAIGILILVVVVYYAYIGRDVSQTPETVGSFDGRNASFVIDGEFVTLSDGIAEREAVPGSSLKVLTRYFGNELKTDLNGDGRTDTVFLVTQEKGGSGTFYYVVGVINTEHGYVGSDGYYLGDRIAPQAINNSTKANHKNVIVVNYAERAKDEPMTAQPSVGKSVYLKMDEHTRWGIVVVDFEGETR